MSGNYIKFLVNANKALNDGIQGCLRPVAETIAANVKENNDLKKNVIMLVGNVPEKDLANTVYDALCSETNMMKVLHDETFLPIKEELYAVLAEGIGDAINNPESLPDEYYVSDMSSPDMRDADSLILGSVEPDKMREFVNCIEKTQIDMAWNFISWAGADYTMLNREHIQKIYGGVGVRSYYLRTAFEILDGAFTVETPTLGFDNFTVDTFPNRCFESAVRENPENYIVIELLVQ